MDGSASVRRALCGTLVPVALTTIALRPEPKDADSGKPHRKVLNEEDYIEVGRVNVNCDVMLNIAHAQVEILTTLVIRRQQRLQTIY